MRATLYGGPRDISVGDRPDPVIEAPTDAVVRVVLSCVCGSDLWYFRGESPHPLGPIGHEFIGVVEDIGADVVSLSVGDLVIAPFLWCCGRCRPCRTGWPSNCDNVGSFGNHGHDGGQGEAVRTGAVGLSAVLASRRLGAERIIALSRHAGRQEVAREFGATDIVEERGDAAVERVLDLTDGYGVDAVMECVGTGQSMNTAFAIAAVGATVGAVGVPHDVVVPINTVIFRNVGLSGGVAPARKYIPELLPDVLSGRINPGRVFDYETDLDNVLDAYQAMDERRAIKSLVRMT